MLRILRRLERIESAFLSLRDEVRANRDQNTAAQARIERAIRADVALASASYRNQEKLMTISEDLLTEVGEIKDATSALETAVDGMLDEIENRSDDPNVVQAVSELREIKGRLIAAALKGTPADPEGPGDSGEPGDGGTPTDQPSTPDEGDDVPSFPVG